MLQSVISIRKAVASDVEAVRDVYLMSRLSAMPWLPVLHAPDDVKHWFEDYVLPFAQVYVAEREGAVVGFAALKDDMLEHLYVLPSYQRCGVGSALLDAVIDRSGDRLRLYTFGRNTLARRFYESRGFHELEMQGVRNEDGEPDILLELEIPEQTAP